MRTHHGYAYYSDRKCSGLAYTFMGVGGRHSDYAVEYSEREIRQRIQLVRCSLVGRGCLYRILNGSGLSIIQTNLKNNENICKTNANF